MWYTLDRMNKYNSAYKIIVGERSNGKTYAIKKLCIDKFKNGLGKFMYLRRTHSKITRSKMNLDFNDIGNYALDELGEYISYSVENGFYYETETSRITIGYATSIEDCYNIKGIPFEDITTIFFDEFLEVGEYIDDEMTKFLNIISTIVRKRTNVEVYMVANLVKAGKFSEYFDLFGIDIKKVIPGRIYYVKHSMGVDCAIERCTSSNIVKGIKQKNRYLGFDNNATANMILYGEWEYDHVNISNVDGIGWSCRRLLLPLYITALKEVYELSLYQSQNPIAFVRKVNTQNGMVSNKIDYNISVDCSLQLTNKKGIVPMYARVTQLLPQALINQINIIRLCIESKRIVFDTMDTGTDFLTVFKQL